LVVVAYGTFYNTQVADVCGLVAVLIDFACITAGGVPIIIALRTRALAPKTIFVLGASRALFAFIAITPASGVVVVIVVWAGFCAVIAVVVCHAFKAGPAGCGAGSGAGRAVVVVGVFRVVCRTSTLALIAGYRLAVVFYCCA